MEPPKNTKVTEWETSTVWFDDDGVMYSKAKPDAPQNRTREQMQEQVNDLKKFTGGKKVCIITQTAPNTPSPKREDRDWIASELNEIVKAMAIIASSPLSRMIATLFFGLKPPPYPAKFFSTEKEAKEWIKQYV